MNKISLIFSLAISLTGIFCNAQTIQVKNGIELQAAMDAAVAGQTIVLADTLFTLSGGGFVVSSGIHGTAQKPITILGSKKAVVSSNNTSSGNAAIWLKGNNYWVLKGFSVRNSKKAIVLDNSHHNLLSGINVRYIGDEGIHLRTYSSYNTVEYCDIDSTGIVSAAAGTAEGVYFGSATSNWVTYTNGDPDTCNYNNAMHNVFGAHIPSENIDIKEGTKGGTISFNTFNGAGLNGANSADSWIDVKGNYYTVECNTGTNTIADGFQTHIQYAGFGDYNTFAGNKLTLGNTGYGIKIQTSGTNGTATHNTVCDNNTVSSSALGLANVNSQACGSTSCLVTEIEVNREEKQSSAFPNPASDFLEFKQLNSELHYNLSSSTGQILKSGIIIPSNPSIDIHALPRGVYYISFDENPGNFRFIKK